VPVVHLRFTPLPEHVRTARLVATTVARRLGLADEALEGIRLAVGEACARAVQRSETLADPQPVEVDLCDDEGRLVVEVRDRARAPAETGSGQLSLTLVEGLADHVHLSDGPAGPGGRLRLEWGTPR
jgi:anti-sigma regulatory factor (Ser/Thr protein kinase)